MHDDNLFHAFYVKSTPYFQIPPGHYLNTLKPIYGLSQTGGSWLQKYGNFLLKKLFQQETYGDMPLYSINQDALHGLLDFYTANMIAASPANFKKLTNEITKYLNPSHENTHHWSSQVSISQKPQIDISSGNSTTQENRYYPKNSLFWRPLSNSTSPCMDHTYGIGNPCGFKNFK